MSWYEQAKERLEKEAKDVSGRREGIMAPAVKKTILDFCAQNEEFAQAVVQGGSFKDCMAAVAKGVGNSISDLDAYKRAASFYFSGATIKFSMTIQLEPAEPETPSKDILLDLADYWG